jgi:hypothetical protein
MTKQEEIFLLVLEDFCSKVYQYYKKIDLSGIFLPNTFPGYENAEKKYFFVGRDSYYWTKFDKMIEYYNDNILSRYIKDNNSILTLNMIIKNSNNNSGSFWTMVIKLHIYLHTGELIDDVNQLICDHKMILQTIGYGNLNSIEVKGTLENMKIWSGIDQNIYWDIKKKSIVFDNLKYILDIYNPDIIFIFNWDNNKEKVAFKDIEVEWYKGCFIESVISIYKVKNYKSFIIWCPHPNSFSYSKSKLNINKLIEIIKEKMKVVGI